MKDPAGVAEGAADPLGLSTTSHQFLTEGGFTERLYRKRQEQRAKR